MTYSSTHNCLNNIILFDCMINLDIVYFLYFERGSQIILSTSSYRNPVSTSFGRDESLVKTHFVGLLRRRHKHAQRRVLRQPYVRHRFRNGASTPDNRNMSYNTGGLPHCHSLVRFGSALQHERMRTAMLALPGSRKDDIEVFIALSARTGSDRKAPDERTKPAEEWYAYVRYGDGSRKERRLMSNTEIHCLVAFGRPRPPLQSPNRTQRFNSSGHV